MDAVGMPSGLRAVGFAEHDIDGLVEGAWAQQRLLALAPIKVDRSDLAAVFRESL
jgi:alcohol dehydrogenase class IV